MAQHGAEEGGVGGRGELEVGDDTLGERGVLLEAEAAIEAEVADEPDGEVLAAVEVEAGEAVELVQDVVAEGLDGVEDEDGDDGAQPTVGLVPFS